MKPVIAVFRSKTETYKFIEYMVSVGNECYAVTTPAKASVGCGVSAKFFYGSLKTAYEIINSGGFSAFKGFYLIEKHGQRTSIVKI